GLDALKAVLAGAHAVQMVSALLRHGPERLTLVRDSLARWLEEHEYDSLAQAQGSFSLLRCPDPTAFERANYLRVLQSWRGGLGRGRRAAGCHRRDHSWISPFRKRSSACATACAASWTSTSTRWNTRHADGSSRPVDRHTRPSSARCSAGRRRSATGPSICQ